MMVIYLQLPQHLTLQAPICYRIQFWFQNIFLKHFLFEEHWCKVIWCICVSAKVVCQFTWIASIFFCVSKFICSNYKSFIFFLLFVWPITALIDCIRIQDFFTHQNTIYVFVSEIHLVSPNGIIKVFIFKCIKKLI